MVASGGEVICLAINKSEKQILQNNLTEKIREIELSVIYLGMALDDLERKGLKVSNEDKERLRKLADTFQKHIK